MAQTLHIPGPRLFTWTANDSIVCADHVHSSDWDYVRLSQAESDEWRGIIREIHGDVPACETCRYGG